ncbi:MAG: hypothetical protein F6K34_07025, partial [Okeania sp. SIO4D6]|nr:hypothetical protein [Okeania sp. SIO4D6]
MISIKKLSIACLGATTIALAINKPASASVFFNSDTGHYYEYVPGESRRSRRPPRQSPRPPRTAVPTPRQTRRRRCR